MLPPPLAPVVGGIVLSAPIKIGHFDVTTLHSQTKVTTLQLLSRFFVPYYNSDIANFWRGYGMLYEKMTLKDQILRLHSTGMKQVDIARQLKKYTNYVWKVVNEQKGKR